MQPPKGRQLVKEFRQLGMNLVRRGKMYLWGIHDWLSSRFQLGRRERTADIYCDHTRGSWVITSWDRAENLALAQFEQNISSSATTPNLTKPEVIIQRGDIFRVDLGMAEACYSLQRPVLVIQNDISNQFEDTVIVVPLSPMLYAKHLQVSVVIPGNTLTGLPTSHVALFSMIRTLPRSVFSTANHLGCLEQWQMAKVDEAIRLSLGLSTLQRIQSRARMRRTS
ncbi:MAG: type II toxin-antitoxin system PemK/MazF family toxin [Firmicutes bacterium]|nr:type II toxin-antitoxin system PemK/MazF family toxin [Bacillota bacterium]